MRLFEASGTTVQDVAAGANVALTTGGRALVAGPIVSDHMDIFANNEGWSGRRLSESTTRFERRLGHGGGAVDRPNFLFVNDGRGSFTNQAGAVGSWTGCRPAAARPSSMRTTTASWTSSTATGTGRTGCTCRAAGPTARRPSGTSPHRR